MVDIAVESRKVSEFPTKASVADADIVPILDSETSTASEKNKKISMTVLKDYCTEAVVQEKITVTPTSGEVTIAVLPNKIYEVSDTVTSITISSVTASNFESEIRLTTDTGTPTLDFPDTLKWIHAVPTLSASTSYVIVIKDNYAVCGKVVEDE